MHKLLLKQIRRIYSRKFDYQTLPDEVLQLLQLISDTYEEHYTELDFIKHTLEINSQELNAANKKIKDRNKELNQLVDERTASLQQAVLRAEHATRAKSNFLATMSHEIRTPMNAIVGFTHLLQTTKLTKAQNNYLENIDNASSNLLSIINDILDFSKIEASKLDIEWVPFLLKKLITEISSLIKPKLEEKGLSWCLYLDKDIPTTLMGDPLRIKQVLINLCSNAIKFTQTGGITLTIKGASLTENEYDLQFSVTDTGIGMSEEQLQHVFMSFTQADSSTTRKYGGTGLGLTISKQLVELMGGDLTVISQLDKGSSFQFNVITHTVASENRPLQDVDISSVMSTNDQQEDVHKIGEEYNFSHLSILLVEDNKVNQIVASKMLEIVGATLDIAENGKIALEYIRENHYDVVLMDMQMPVMDGLEATTLIRKKLHKSHLPIIAMTANAMKGDEEKCLNAGMNAYLSKPIKRDTLYRTIAQYVL